MTPLEARDKRGWTTYEAAQRMLEVSESSLTNLEEHPEIAPRIMLKTALEVIRLYWPDVQLSDLLHKKRYVLKVLPRDKEAEKLLRGRPAELPAD